MKIFVATGAFMVAMVAAMLFSAIRYCRISPLLWFSESVVILGGLTIWLHDEHFIKMKPTYYVPFRALWFASSPTVPCFSGCSADHPGSRRAGWTKLTRNGLVLRIHGRA
jgi:intracellular septation protein